MKQLSFVVRTTSWGGRDISHLKEAIPNLLVCTGYDHEAKTNFINAINFVDGPLVVMEDDIELCDNFVERVTEAVNQYPDRIINFFSMRKKDYELQRPYEELGAKYLMNQCFYLPEGYASRITEFFDSWDGKFIHKGGTDTLVADFLKSEHLKYIQWFPHLVNHKIGKSIIDPHRSSMRIDKNFKK